MLCHQSAAFNIVTLQMFLPVISVMNTGNMHQTATIVTSSSDSLSADACVTVMFPCWQNGINIIADSTFSSSLGTGFTNAVVYIENRFYVDNDFTFDNCTVYVAPGGQIIVMNDFTLTLDSTDVQGCTGMWQRIMLRDPGSKVVVKNHSKVRDAEYGIYARNRTKFNVYDSDITECIVGIYTEPDTTGNYNDITGKVYGSRFGMWNSGMFKPDYPGQPPHGLIPKAGMELNNVTGMVIGNNAYNSNLFNRMNTGITAIGSAIKITNCAFMQMFEDTAYAKPYNGTAVVSVSEPANSLADLTLLPLAGGGVTIHSCKRGVYTLYSSARILNLEMTGVETGVFATKCSDHKTTLVSGCTIHATWRGIDFRDNHTAAQMIASSNAVIVAPLSAGPVKNSACIYMDEITPANNANYRITDNYHLESQSANMVIGVRNVENALIAYNQIFTNSGVIPAPGTRGIMLQGGSRNTVNCNYVYNTIPHSNTGTAGLWVSISNNNTIQCNVFGGNSAGNNPGPYTGIFFGGNCDLFNDLAGNTMTDCHTGLFLNSTARIGKQKHRGNRWLPAGGNTEAINQNTFNFNYLNSLITYNPNNGLQFYPTSITPPQWFYPDFSGTAFTGCGTQVCNAAIAGGGGGDVEEQLKAVARDSAISYDYMQENKNQAQQNLYKLLSEDSLLRLSDSVFVNFFGNKQSAAIGKLHEVNNLYSLSAVYDSALVIQLDSTARLMALKTDSIFYLDSLMLADSTLNLMPLRESLTDDLNSLKAALQALLLQKQAAADSVMESARYLNNTIVPAELPEINSKAMNEYLYLYQKFGSDTLLPYFNDLLSIAQQCPYAGGKAVYQARAMLSLLNDSLEYDDAAVCLQSGIYRQLLQDSKNQNPAFDFRLIPNPASQQVRVELNFKNENSVKFEIRNVLGGKVKEVEIDKGIGSITFSVENFDDGIYFIRARKDGITLNTKKLIIIK
jgi:hypothetical protein